MSFFSKNIKKIRSLRKLNQTQFAELFGVKRSSIGAYEEGRAEPKLEMIIKIANHFSISVDKLINSELTVNELSHFNIFDEAFNKEYKQKPDKLKILAIAKFPLAQSFELTAFTLDELIKKAANHISLPSLSEDHLAIVISRDSFKYIPENFANNDIIIISPEFTLEDQTSLADKYWIFKIQNTLYIGELKRLNKNESLFFPHDSSPVTIHNDDFEFIFPVEATVSYNPEIIMDESAKIRKMENQIKDLYNRISIIRN